MTDWLRHWNAKRKAAYPAWFLAALLIAGVVLLPVALVLLHLMDPEGPAWAGLRDTVLADYVTNTVTVGLGGFALSLVFGISSAWLVSVYRFPLSRFFGHALYLPLAIPTYIVAYAYSDVFGYGGPFEAVQGLFMAPDSIWRPDIKNPFALTVLYALVLFPYVFIPCKMVFGSRLGSYYEAAMSLGMKPARVFFSVMLPLARPAAVGGGFLVLMEILNDFGGAKYFGVTTLTTGIFGAWFSKGDLGTAVRFAAMLVFGVLLLIWLERKMRGRAAYTEKNTGTPITPTRLVGAARWLAFGWCALLFFFGFALVAGRLLFQTIWVRDKFPWAKLADSTWNSFAMAGLGAMLIVTLALLMAYNGRLHHSRATLWIERTSSIGYVLPGAVIAVGVLALSTGLDAMLRASGWQAALLTGSLGILMLAYVSRFFAVGLKQLEPAFEKIPRSRDEAGLALGKSPGFILTRLHLPLMPRHLIAVGILVFIDLLKELPLTLILRPFNYHTLATQTFAFADNEMLRLAAVPALCIVLCGMLPLLLSSALLSKK